MHGQDPSYLRKSNLFIKVIDQHFPNIVNISDDIILQSFLEPFISNMGLQINVNPLHKADGSEFSSRNQCISGAEQCSDVS